MKNKTINHLLEAQPEIARAMSLNVIDEQKDIVELRYILSKLPAIIGRLAQRPIKL